VPQRRGWCGSASPCVPGGQSLCQGLRDALATPGPSLVRPQQRAPELGRDDLLELWQSLQRVPSWGPPPLAVTGRVFTGVVPAGRRELPEPPDFTCGGSGDLLGVQEAADGVAGLRTASQPVLDALGIQ